MNKQQIEKVKHDLQECLSASCRGYHPGTYCPHRDEEWDILRDALSVIEELQAEIERLQPKKGKWIFTGQKNVYGGTVIQCPFCDDKYAAEHPCAEHFCRNCGAKLMD